MKKPKQIRWSDLQSECGLIIVYQKVFQRKKCDERVTYYSFSNPKAVWYVWNNRQSKGGEIPLSKTCIVKKDDETGEWVCVQSDYYNWRNEDDKEIILREITIQ